MIHTCSHIILSKSGFFVMSRIHIHMAIVQYWSYINSYSCSSVVFVQANLAESSLSSVRSTKKKIESAQNIDCEWIFLFHLKVIDINKIKINACCSYLMFLLFSDEKCIAHNSNGSRDRCQEMCLYTVFYMFFCFNTR